MREFAYDAEEAWLARQTRVLAGLSRLLSMARRRRFFVRPDTLLRWHRDLVRRRWTYFDRVFSRPSKSRARRLQDGPQGKCYG